MMRTWHITTVAAGAALFAFLAAGPGAAATARDTVPELRAGGEPAASTTEQAREKLSSAERDQEVTEVDIADFGGLSGADEVFEIRVNEAYIDDDGTVTDGLGSSETAPEGMDYAVFNIQITNVSDAPAAWDGMDHLATGASGKTYANDIEAEFAAADDYFPGETLNPGASVETDAIFAIPPGENLVEVELRSTFGVAPVTLAP
ncbi:DUF4352 domain-containing protein [Halostreptopolyspora alba]|uniref:DUF4352 domain-containing protein n=1 Tax=Halostreptopolyspora alba TaxID=2487137 RepID=A0A3N0ECH2_9ACTN|nr:DUF4352 domain-containing protein [Nocardiopsaceae bacterium YIM 96095]